MAAAKIILKKGRDESLHRFHPWVFSGAVAWIEGAEPAEGDLVGVYSAAGECLGCGHYQVGSITVRMLAFGTPALLPDVWEERLLSERDDCDGRLPSERL